MVNDRCNTPLVGVLSHPSYRHHDAGDRPDDGATVDRILAAIAAAPWSGQVMRYLPRAATPEQVAFAHDPTLVELVRTSAENGARLGLDSSETALMAAGRVITAVDEVMREARPRPDGVFCALRPPGHHASRDRAMGFCLVNNVAVGARYAQQTYGLDRVLILDWDAHHGNGWLTDVGRVDGEGFTVNVPLPPGAGDPVIQAAFERIFEPIAEQFAPQLILVSAGLDGHAGDPLSDLMVTLDGFRWLTRAVRRLAGRTA